MRALPILWITIATALGASGMGSESVQPPSLQPIGDESLRLQVLHSIFPAMPVARGVPNEIPSSTSDALAKEPFYSIVGPPQNEAEQGASEDLISGNHSTTRQLRFKLFQWPNESDSGLLAVLQYDFQGANPSLGCPSIGVLVHLIRNADKWSVKDQLLLETMHHSLLQNILLVDLKRKEQADLVIESD